MNFFEHQEKARSQSKKLVFLFILAIIMVVIAIDIVVLVVLGGRLSFTEQLGLLGGVTLTILISMGLATLYRMYSLRLGGKAVAEQLGAIRVPMDTRDPALQRLNNVVAEIAIASGVPMPSVYLLEDEMAINAFAAGYSPSDAVVAVTRGCLQYLNRNELQGVIAHEFSHILNGDMRLNIRLMGGLFGILILSVIGQKFLQYTRIRGKDGAPFIIICLALIILGSVGVFFGRLIKASVSRQREYLADASAVQFTRQTEGLTGALKKIGGLSTGSKLNDAAGTEEISHMLFGEGKNFSDWFATHPPLLERIQRLEPQFNANHLQQLQNKWHDDEPDGMQEDIAFGLTSSTSNIQKRNLSQTDNLSQTSKLSQVENLSQAKSISPTQTISEVERLSRINNVSPAETLAQMESLYRPRNTVKTSSISANHVANPTDEHYLSAAQIMSEIPPELYQKLNQLNEVKAILLGLLIDKNPDIAILQFQQIKADINHEMVQKVQFYYQHYLQNLAPLLRLPLASLGFPILSQSSVPMLKVFSQLIHKMVHIDGQVSIFEYCFSSLLQMQINEIIQPRQTKLYGNTASKNIQNEFCCLLSIMAKIGHPNQSDIAEKAYFSGMKTVASNNILPYNPPDNVVAALDTVIPELDLLQPKVKQFIIDALVLVVGFDGNIAVEEAELLRLVCARLHCPLPALLH